MNIVSIIIMFVLFSFFSSIIEQSKRKNQRSLSKKYVQSPTRNMTESNYKTTEANDLNDRTEYTIETENQPIMTEEQISQQIIVEPNDSKNDFNFSELQNSVIIAEILGPPRALKRNIR